jgi:hypothetical protein
MPPGMMAPQFYAPQIVPPMMTPQGPAPWAAAQPTPVCVPYSEPYPAPAPNLFCAPAPPQEPKTYKVAMALVEQAEAKKPTVVALPKLSVLENQPAQVANGTSHADLWEMGVPANDFGHEGYQINLGIAPEKPGHVRVTCWVWTSELGEKSDTDTSLHESRCYTTRVVELGKPVAFDCDRLWGSHGVRCHLDMTITEESVASVWHSPSLGTFGSYEPCGRPDGYNRSMTYPPIEPPPPPPPVCSQPCTAPAAPAQTMRFTTVEAKCDGDPMADAQGKLADVKGTPSMLEVTCNETKMTCQKMDLKQPGCQDLCVSIQDGQVHLKGKGLTASADTVVMESGAEVILEGHVHLNSTGDEVDVKQGKVRISLVHQTGVISSPALIQE